MNRKVFEYQIDSRELEPYYSKYVRGRKSRQPATGEQATTTELAAETIPPGEGVPSAKTVEPTEPESEATTQTPTSNSKPQLADSVVVESTGDARADTGRVR